MYTTGGRKSRYNGGMEALHFSMMNAAESNDKKELDEFIDNINNSDDFFEQMCKEYFKVCDKEAKMSTMTQFNIFKQNLKTFRKYLRPLQKLEDFSVELKEMNVLKAKTDQTLNSN